MNRAIDFGQSVVRRAQRQDPGYGKGIYENPGMIGIVYTYSKVGDLNATIYPCFRPSSFQISFNWWLLILTLYGVYRTASHMMSLKMAGYLTVF